MRDKIFKLSLSNLKEAQIKLKDKKIFRLNKNNYKDYEAFILNSMGEFNPRYLNRTDV
jgi:hypothetical protein